ncbi:MAG: C4-type zinc ribbon domain-containing protein [Candidatus Omnitrophica bacterium]|nr:C4-type zinc ribbon domain-containing protein [Candidatus Omnitrophota bacterium]
MIDNLKSQMVALVSLQKVDSEIYSLKNELAAKPLALEAIQKAFEDKKKNLAYLQQKLLDLQKSRKERELELGTNEESIKKLQGQLYSLKTNKEFQVMLKQIQDAKADSSVIEEKILVLFDETDKLNKEVENENLKLQQEEKLSSEEKNKVDLRVKEINDRLSVLNSQRKQAVEAVTAKMLSQYERILQSRDGLAIVSVKDNSCGGCHMLVPPQVINSIKMYEQIITCEVCNRILYIQE